VLDTFELQLSLCGNQSVSDRRSQQQPQAVRAALTTQQVGGMEGRKDGWMRV